MSRRHFGEGFANGAWDAVMLAPFTMPIVFPLITLHEHNMIPTWLLWVLGFWVFMLADEAVHVWFPRLLRVPSFSQRLRSPAPLGSESAGKE